MLSHALRDLHLTPPPPRGRGGGIHGALWPRRACLGDIYKHVQKKDRPLFNIWT
jgi:hypothetical protein